MLMHYPIRILTPIPSKTTPPTICDLLPKNAPNLRPMKKANKHNTNVTMPMMETAENSFTCNAAKLTPTTNASMLVANA